MAALENKIDFAVVFASNNGSSIPDLRYEVIEGR